MKKHSLYVLLTLFWAPSLFGQDAVSNYFNHYSEQDDYKTVYVTKRMFALAAQVAAGTEDRELEEAISNIQGLRSISSEHASRASFREFRSQIPRSYETLLEVMEHGEQAVFWIKTDHSENIKELVMLQEDKQKIVLVSIFGDIDLQQLAKLAYNMNINGLEKLNRLEDK